MLKTIEKKIESFVRAELAGVHRIDFVHGTLYLTLDKPSLCDFIHKEIRKFYKENINPEGGVNMYAVGDEFAFDFVPEDREAPVFVEPYSDEEYSGKEGMMPDDIDYGIWSEFAEEEILNNQEPDDSKVDTAMQLEIESLKGK
jgi:hypothetical protein